MPYYRHRLPHWQPEGRTYFITFRLRGSLPRGRFFNEHRLSAGQVFVVHDRVLDGAKYGPVWLSDSRIARVVAETLHYYEEEMQYYELFAWVVMSNHVHLLVRPIVPIAKLMRVLKGYTARQANQLLHREGHAFWQVDYFDRVVRTEQEFWRIVDYIERNPVKAGMVERPEEYRWSSAYRQVGEDSSTAAGADSGESAAALGCRPP